jgi:hypothetical protein
MTTDLQSVGHEQFATVSSQKRSDKYLNRTAISFQFSADIAVRAVKRVSQFRQITQLGEVTRKW